MNPLALLQRRLHWLGRHRLLSRLAVAASNLLAAGLISLAIVFVADYLLALAVGPRTVCVVTLLLVLVWRATREAERLWQAHETPIDLALLLERRHRLDTDLVAALQFAAPGANAAGPNQLASAVIEHAAQLAAGLDYGSVIPWRQTWRHVRWGIGAVLTVVAVVIAFPEPTRVFGQRLLLGDAEYPTRTRIDSVTINGQPCMDGQSVTLAERSALVFSVACSGVAANDARVRLETWNAEETLWLPLQRTGGHESQVYHAEGPTLTEALKFRVQVGDARAFTGLLSPIPRPLVEVTTEIIPPDYARQVLDTELCGERQCSALAGSTIGFEVRSVNGKCLQAATLSLTTGGETTNFALVEEEGAVWRWRPASAPSSWSQVRGDVSYRLDVEDADGLSLEQPVVGHITVRSDQPPQVTVATLHSLVMAQAKPIIRYQADDNFGVTRLVLHVRWESKSAADDPMRSRTFDLPLADSPARGTALPVTGEFALPLSELELNIGDRLTITCEAVDYRDSPAGVAAISEPVTFLVADEQATLQAILATDAEAEHLLNSAIEHELGLGRSE